MVSDRWRIHFQSAGAGSGRELAIVREKGNVAGMLVPKQGSRQVNGVERFEGSGKGTAGAFQYDLVDRNKGQAGRVSVCGFLSLRQRLLRNAPVGSQTLECTAH